MAISLFFPVAVLTAIGYDYSKRYVYVSSHRTNLTTASPHIL